MCENGCQESSITNKRPILNLNIELQDPEFNLPTIAELAKLSLI